MNIFWLDEDMDKCVQYMTDRHIVKMITETAQILCSAYYYTGQDDLAHYNLTHKNHPRCVWVRESLDNWLWLKDLGLRMYGEYQYRYEGRTHKAGEVINRLVAPNLPSKGITPRPLCMPPECKVDNVIQSYRNYYNQCKRHIFSWKRREVPYWIEGFDLVG